MILVFQWNKEWLLLEWMQRRFWIIILFTKLKAHLMKREEEYWLLRLVPESSAADVSGAWAHFSELSLATYTYAKTSCLIVFRCSNFPFFFKPFMVSHYTDCPAPCDWSCELSEHHIYLCTDQSSWTARISPSTVYTSPIPPCKAEPHPPLPTQLEFGCGFERAQWEL